MEKNISEIICTPEACPVTLAASVIGGKWKPSIIYLISLGVGRFGKMQRALPQISKSMLTQELRDLEKNGIIHRKVFAEVPPRVEYTLTEAGQRALPILEAMALWARTLQPIQHLATA